MNLKNTNTLIETVLIPLLCLFSLAINAQNNLDSISDYLDDVIMNKQQFTDQKEQRIKVLKNLLKANNSCLEYKYEINQKLYHEYKKLKIDSAIFYAERNTEIASILEGPAMKYKSNIDLAALYSYAGRFRESEEILRGISSSKLPKELLESYYETYVLFFGHYKTISNQSKYDQLIKVYRDSLITVQDTTSLDYKINKISNYNKEECEKQLFILLKYQNTDSPEYASIAHTLGGFYGGIGNLELAKKYYMLSAIADVKSSIKENASFQRLAFIYFNDGDISKAFKYAQSAIEDAVYSGVQFRTTEMSKLYSIINASNQIKEEAAKKQLKISLLWISLLTLFLILLVLYVYKQMKKLSGIKEVLSQTNAKLVELNQELNEANNQLNDKNGQLWESNHIKEQYIAQFFDSCSTYIDKMEIYRKTLYKLGINKQYEELIKELKSTTAIDNELEELYTQFDSIFSKLYPTFITEFNALLAKDEQLFLKSNVFLNKEMRIYALLRLGITDSIKIASFLRCSLSTIYNYRTKMRNKAASNREEFEEMVMKIGTMPSNTD